MEICVSTCFKYFDDPEIWLDHTGCTWSKEHADFLIDSCEL